MSSAALEAARLALASDNAARALRARAEVARAACQAARAAPASPPGAGPRADDVQCLSRDAALLSVLADLVMQGWKVAITPPDVTLRAPAGTASGGEAAEAVKARIRSALEAMRADALAEPPTQEFLRRVETRRPFAGRRVSILDLVDDGASLASSLGDCAGLPPAVAEERVGALVRPYVEPVLPGARCATTNIELMDVWRYFRLTWALPYRSTPGRTFPFLVRNAARPGRPVMGIGALASPVAQLARRDDWVGWTLPALKRRLAQEPGWWPRQLAALQRTLRRTLSEVRLDDLLLDAAASSAPSLEEALLALSREAAAARIAALQPRRLPQGEPQEGSPPAGGDGSPEVASDAVRRGIPSLSDGHPDWLAASEDLLFRRKRAKVAAELLASHRALALAPSEAGEALARLESDEAFARAVGLALRECRKLGIASRVLDLSVCGAVAPYGPLLGGKLVALAVASGELRAAYQARYAGQVSEIASQMAGREVTRAADYCAVTTTSLYGVASSQYNRLAVPLGGDDGRSIRWLDLGQSVGFGTVHLSKQTLAALTEATEAHYGGRNVNYRFGEGNSPSLRQAREGLRLLIDDPNSILNHEAPRRVYGLEVAPGARAALCLDEPLLVDAPTMDEIAEAWRRRWLHGRAASPKVLEVVAAQGPRTVRERLSRVSDEHSDQLGLFAGLPEE